MDELLKVKYSIIIIAMLAFIIAIFDMWQRLEYQNCILANNTTYQCIKPIFSSGGLV